MSTPVRERFKDHFRRLSGEREERLRQKALAVSEALIDQIGAGTVTADSVASLKDLRDLLTVHEELGRSKSRLVPVVIVLLVLAAIAFLDWIKVRNPDMRLEVLASRVDGVTGDAPMGSMVLFSPSRRVRFLSWADVDAPNNCEVPANQTVERDLEIESSGETSGPDNRLGLGDASALPSGTAFSFRSIDEANIALDTSAPLRVSVAVSSGHLRVRRPEGPPIECDLNEAVAVKTSALAFSPTQPVGPIVVSKAKFEDHPVMADARPQVLSTIRSGSLEFSSVPGHHLSLVDGDLVEVFPEVGKSLTLFLRTEKNDLRTTVRGAVSSIRIAGRDVRPSLLDYLSSSPSLKLLVAGISGAVAIIFALVRWFGYSA